MIYLLLIALLVAWYLVVKWRNRRMTRLAEQLKSSMVSLPLLGHAYMLLGNAETTMKGLQKIFRDAIECGGTVAHWFTNKLYITVADPEVADIILKNSLEKDDLMKFFRVASGDGSLFASVEKWRPRRKFIAPNFSMANLNRFVEVFATQSAIFVEKLEKLVGQDPSPMAKLISSYTMDAICETTLGFQPKAQEKENPNLAAIENAFHVIKKRIYTPWLHSDIIFERTSLHRILTKCIAQGYGFVDEIIEKKRKNQAKIKNLSNENQSDRVKSFLELVLESACAEESDKVIREECMLLLVAGTDSSAVSMGFTLVMLAAYPEVQEKVYRELKEIIGDSSRPVQADDLHRLKYLDAVIRENLRLYPPVPCILRKIEKDMELPSGVVVPAGCGALIGIWGIHHNPAIWGKDVEEFRPERFLEPTPRHPTAFIPFSFGPRNCVGYQYGIMSLKTVLCTVLRKFRLVPASEVRQPLRLENDILMRDVDQYRVGIEMRH